LNVRGSPGSRRRERGYTLVEVIIAGLLGAFVLLSTEVAWWNATQTVVRGTSELDLARDAGFVLDSVIDVARSSASFTVANYGSKTANLVVLTGTGGTEVARFYWNPTDNKVYYGKNGATPSKFIASTVQALTFTASGKELTTALTLTDIYSQLTAYTGTALLRN
jgi:Tfp pilus assembly protein PilW